MYRIYLDGELFYDPRLPKYALTGIKCDLEVNKTGTLRFTIPATHPLIGSVQKMYSELTLYQEASFPICWTASSATTNTMTSA